MIKLGEKALFTLLLLVFVVVITGLTFALGPAARLVPLAVAIPTLGLLVCQLSVDLVPHLALKFSVLEQKDLFNVESLRRESALRSDYESSSLQTDRSSNELNVILWLSLLFLLIYLFGFSIALPGYVLLYLKARSRESWLVSFAIAAGMFCFVRGVFVYSLRLQLYEGLLWDLLSHVV